jgi:hypothetical protein
MPTASISSRHIKKSEKNRAGNIRGYTAPITFKEKFPKMHQYLEEMKKHNTEGMPTFSTDKTVQIISRTPPIPLEVINQYMGEKYDLISHGESLRGFLLLYNRNTDFDMILIPEKTYDKLIANASTQINLNMKSFSDISEVYIKKQGPSTFRLSFFPEFARKQVNKIKFYADGNTYIRIEKA